jgi:hypothetical protein
MQTGAHQTLYNDVQQQESDSRTAYAGIIGRSSLSGNGGPDGTNFAHWSGQSGLEGDEERTGTENEANANGSLGGMYQAGYRSGENRAKRRKEHIALERITGSENEVVDIKGVVLGERAEDMARARSAARSAARSVGGRKQENNDMQESSRQMISDASREGEHQSANDIADENGGKRTNLNENADENGQKSDLNDNAGGGSKGSKEQVTSIIGAGQRLSQARSDSSANSGNRSRSRSSRSRPYKKTIVSLEEILASAGNTQNPNRLRKGGPAAGATPKNQNSKQSDSAGGRIITDSAGAHINSGGSHNEMSGPSSDKASQPSAGSKRSWTGSEIRTEDLENGPPYDRKDGDGARNPIPYLTEEKFDVSFLSRHISSEKGVEMKKTAGNFYLDAHKSTLPLAFSPKTLALSAFFLSNLSFLVNDMGLSTDNLTQ